MNKIYRYAGLPPYWGGKPKGSLELSDIRWNKIIKALDNIGENPKKILWLGQIAPIVNHIVDTKGLKSVRGIDFTTYFSNVFNKEAAEPTLGKYTVVYNIGLEKALNLSFSKQILKGLIQKIIDFGGHVFLQSTQELSKLRSDYDIDFKNVIRLPEKQEEDLL